MTNVICDSITCSFNYEGICIKEDILIKDLTCYCGLINKDDDYKLHD